MAANLIIAYDRIGDRLYLGKTAPYPEQESEELDYGKAHNGKTIG